MTTGYGVEKKRAIPSGWKRKSLKPSGKALKVRPFFKLTSTLGFTPLHCGDWPKGEIVVGRLREKLPLRAQSWYRVDARNVVNLREMVKNFGSCCLFFFNHGVNFNTSRR